MAASFNGSSDVYDMGVGPNLLLGNTIALVCWVNFSVLNVTQTFVAGGFTGSTTAYQFQSAAGTPPTLFWGSFDGAPHGPTWNSTWSTGQWHHVYGHYTGPGTTTWSLYIDGVFAQSSFDATGIQAGRHFTAGAVDNVGTAVQFLNGCLADVALFNGPLTLPEISGLGTGTLRPNGVASQPLLGYWPMDVGGATTPDNSVNGNIGATGVLAGSTTNPGTCGTSPPYNVGLLNIPRSKRIIPYWIQR